jgi:GT2 family glycosyltransferase
MAPLGIYIADLRNKAVKAAQAAGASHLLFLDSDMRFPEDTLDRLLAHNLDIVAANYVQRTMSEWCVARIDGVPVQSQGRTGLEAVDTTGTGVMLITMSVFDDMPQPWFDTPNFPFTGEDVYFCQQARSGGYDVWIDHDLSQDVRHQGSVELSVQQQPVLA